MKGKQIVAIDVGSTNVVMAVGSVEEDGRVDILGIASEPISSGINAGRIENSETVGRNYFFFSSSPFFSIFSCEYYFTTSSSWRSW